ncbi:hypothetical protein BU14_0234s0036 [Porphyra umbilicalis]|uniref:Uncharacterized protein n=1 Tax=Porphyra umbilicalis TaxID=2786 RepID=A0A1X6P3Q7_PORUM|nr:hypothetical protein BU14_0234s0036 [Porphyra umbilicalis]|eukprot:OSX75509.1 hypothetical protein BU14_0234s0036 [Porphyra umbilicalis]
MGFLTRAAVLAAASAVVATVARGVTGLGSCDREPCVPVRFFFARGAAAGDIKGAVDRFSTALGDDNGSGPPARGGRRSINWDADGVPFDMPGDFFNTAVPRGAVFHAKGGEFRVSNPPPVQHIVDNQFTSLNKNLSVQLKPFSAPRLFTPLRDNVVEVRFEVPGKRGATAATKGFGAVLLDVDLEHVTTLAYYDVQGRRLAKMMVPAKAGGLSFLGLLFNELIVAYVRMTLGNAKVTDRDGGHRDVVVADNFVYGEPVRA